MCIPLGGREGATLKEEAAFSCRLRNASSIKSRRRRERKEVAKKEAKYAAGHNPYGGQRGREKTLVEKAAKASGDGSIDGERSRCIFPYLPLLSSSRSAIGKRRNKLPPAGDASTAAIQTELLRFPLSLFSIILCELELVDHSTPTVRRIPNTIRRFLFRLVLHPLLPFSFVFGWSIASSVGYGFTNSRNMQTRMPLTMLTIFITECSISTLCKSW